MKLIVLLVLALSSSLFGGLMFGDHTYHDLWQQWPADPADPEVQRNIGITQPALWIK